MEELKKCTCARNNCQTEHVGFMPWFPNGYSDLIAYHNQKEIIFGELRHGCSVGYIIGSDHIIDQIEKHLTKPNQKFLSMDYSMYLTNVLSILQPYLDQNYILRGSTQVHRFSDGVVLEPRDILKPTFHLLQCKNGRYKTVDKGHAFYDRYMLYRKLQT